jgi:small subunit ribosomal protein S2
MGVHIIAVVDTNCNPDGVDTILPGNDDAIRAIRLFSSVVADAIIKGKARKKDEEELAEAFKAEQEIRDKADKEKAAAETKEAAPATAVPDKTKAPAPAEAVQPDPAPADPAPPAEPPKE